MQRQPLWRRGEVGASPGGPYAARYGSIDLSIAYMMDMMFSIIAF